MNRRTAIKFEIGKAFPADEPLARWLTVCAMALNDILLVHRWLFPSVHGKSPDYANNYLSRLGAAHLFEAAKFLADSDKLREVRDFVAELDQDHRDSYQRLVALANGGPGFPADLAHARNHFFHYAEPLPHAPDHEKLRQALVEHRSTIGEIQDEGPSVIEGFRARFADDVAIELSYPEDKVQLPAFMSDLAQRIPDFTNFASAVLVHYIQSLPNDHWEWVEESRLAHLKRLARNRWRRHMRWRATPFS